MHVYVYVYVCVQHTCSQSVYTFTTSTHLTGKRIQLITCCCSDICELTPLPQGKLTHTIILNNCSNAVSSTVSCPLYTCHSVHTSVVQMHISGML